MRLGFTSHHVDGVLHHLPRCVPAKLLKNLASHLPLIAVLHFLLRSCHRRPLPLVLSLFESHCRISESS